MAAPFLISDEFFLTLRAQTEIVRGCNTPEHTSMESPARVLLVQVVPFGQEAAPVLATLHPEGVRAGLRL